MEIRKLFKLLEFTLQGKQFPLEKMRRKETANSSVNSESFIDPHDVTESEAIRLKDSPINDHDPNLFY